MGSEPCEKMEFTDTVCTFFVLKITLEGNGELRVAEGWGNEHKTHTEKRCKYLRVVMIDDLYVFLQLYNIKYKFPKCYYDTSCICFMMSH